MDSMKIQMIKARIMATVALITTVMLAAVGAETENIWFRIAAFVFMGLFANITITRTIAASIHASAVWRMIALQADAKEKANR